MKPDNIIFDSTTNRLCVLDLEFAYQEGKENDPRLRRDVLPTLMNSPPEQQQQTLQRPWNRWYSDCWAAGVIFLHAVSQSTSLLAGFCAYI